jgi:nucleoid DNA-binding protein
VIKLDIINRVADKTGVPKMKAEQAVEALFHSMKEALTRGERIELRGFGVFVVKPRNEASAGILAREKKSRFRQAKRFASSPAKSYRRMMTATVELMIQTTTTTTIFRSSGR